MCCNSDPDGFDFERPESRTGAAQSAETGESEPSVADSLAPLRAEFDELRRHDETVTTALRDDDFAQRMLDDPLAALTELGIEVPPIIKRQLNDQAPAPAVDSAVPISCRTDRWSRPLPDPHHGCAGGGVT
jgi:hypothetical protein